MIDGRPILSICTTCRDGRERADCLRGGARLAQAVLARTDEKMGLELRGVRCMSQCKRPCVASLTAHRRFTYVFGDLDPEKPDYIDALLDLVLRYKNAPEGFLARDERPNLLRANILGRLPPIGSQSTLVSSLDPNRDDSASAA